MKKSIFVTIEEFVFNNGKLEAGRELYTKQKNGQFLMLGTYKEYNEFTMNVIAENGHGSFPVSNHITYVEIECTPIYK